MSDASGEQEDDLSSADADIPVAAIAVLTSLTVFLLAVLVLLCLRKWLMRRRKWPLELCPTSSCCEGCGVRWGGVCGGDQWRALAEKLDCTVPDCDSCLDNVCPSKQQCSMWCGRVWSCYCWLVVVGYCKTISCNLCPDCSAFECPDLSCCGQCCHCKMKTPDCSHITCLCCDLDCAQIGGTTGEQDA